jgi:hypothetical protein
MSRLHVKKDKDTHSIYVPQPFCRFFWLGNDTSNSPLLGLLDQHALSSLLSTSAMNIP